MRATASVLATICVLFAGCKEESSPSKPTADESASAAAKAEPKPTLEVTAKADSKTAAATADAGHQASVPDAAPKQKNVKRESVRDKQKEKIRREVAALAKIIGGDDKGSSAKVSGDLSKTITDIRLSRDRVAHSGRPPGAAKRATGQPRIATSPGAKSPGSKASKVRSRVTVTFAAAEDSTSLTARMVERKLRSTYSRSLKHCHEQLLKTNPTARGKVTIRLRVSETGRVSGVATRGFDTKLNKCLQASARRFRFPPPTEDGEATQARFRITVSFRPG